MLYDRAGNEARGALERAAMTDAERAAEILGFIAEHPKQAAIALARINSILCPYLVNNRLPSKDELAAIVWLSFAGMGIDTGTNDDIERYTGDLH